MSLLDILLSDQGGDAVSALGKQFGLSNADTTGALTNLIPSLAKGLSQNSSQSGGLEQLMKALQSGGHDKVLDRPDLLSQAETTQEGNAILGHILGSKEVSRNVASHAAAQTGIGQDILKKMLPLVATMAMGALSKKTAEPSLGSLMGSVLGGGKASDSQLGMLGSLLDADGDGNVASEVLGMAARLFKK
jgi:hypothetical protein